MKDYAEFGPLEISAMLRFAADVGEYDTPLYRLMTASADYCAELQEYYDECEDAAEPTILPPVERTDCIEFGHCKTKGDDCRGCNDYLEAPGLIVVKPCGLEDFSHQSSVPNPTIVTVDGVPAEEIKE